MFDYTHSDTARTRRKRIPSRPAAIRLGGTITGWQVGNKWFPAEQAGAYNRAKRYANTLQR